MFFISWKGAQGCIWGKRKRSLIRNRDKFLKVSEEESNLEMIMHKSANSSRQCVEGYNTEIAQITGEASFNTASTNGIDT